MTDYYAAQVCRNGHITNDAIQDDPNRSMKFCDKCGEATVSKCESCKTWIRGREVSDGFAWSFPLREPPAYCNDCGQPYPWTQSKMEAAAEMIDLFDEIDEGDKQKLKDSLPDLARQTPKSDVAVKRWQTIAKKLGGDVYDMLIKVGTDVASEYTKKVLTGQP